MPRGKLEESTTRRKIRAMTEQGINPREIAGALGITTQAVYKHLKAIDASKPPPKERAS